MNGYGMRRREFLRAASILAGTATTVTLGEAIGIAGGQQSPERAGPRTAARQFSLAYLTLFGCPPPEMTYIAGRAGYEFVSLRPIYMGLPGEPNFDLSANPQMLRQTKTALASSPGPFNFGKKTVTALTSSGPRPIASRTRPDISS